MGGLTRKELLAGAAAAGVVAGCGGSSDKPPPTTRATGRRSRRSSRSRRDVRHFDAFVLATHPKPVREAIERHRRGLDADPAGYIHAHELELDERVLEAAARLPRGSAGLRVHRLDHDGPRPRLRRHPDRGPARWPPSTTSTRRTSRCACASRTSSRSGSTTTRRRPPWARWSRRPEASTPGLLALTWVHSGTGVKIPAQEIAEAVRPALVVLDGVHGLAADDLPIDSVDVLVAGTHKWLGGPRGTGLVWSRAWDRLRPFIPTFHPGSPAASWNPGGYHTVRAPLGARRGVRLPPPDRPHRGHQADPEPRHAAQGGPRRAADVRLVTPMAEEVSAGIVCFEVDGLDPPTAVMRLGSAGSPPRSRPMRSRTCGWHRACGSTRPTWTPR